MTLSDQQLMLADKNDINSGFLQIVNSETIYKQALPKFLSVDEVHVIANDEEGSLYQRDSDCDNRYICLQIGGDLIKRCFCFLQ